ncbi:MAG: hypothetical protein ACXABY_11730, partial [Candidatus Thorarchaeota archaeon]
MASSQKAIVTVLGQKYLCFVPADSVPFETTRLTKTIRSSARTQTSRSLSFEGRIPLLTYGAVQLVDFTPANNPSDVAEPYVLFAGIEYRTKDNQCELMSDKDLDPIIHRGIIEGYQTIVDAMSNTGDMDENQPNTPDCIIGKQVIIAESSNLDVIEKGLQGPGLRRIKSAEKDMIIIQISTFGQNVVLDDEFKEKGVKVWRGLKRRYTAPLPETYIIIQEKVDYDNLQLISNASEKIFHLNLNGIMLNSLIWANIEYSRLLEGIPRSKPTNLKDQEKLYDALVDIQSQVDNLRRVQLLAHEWVFLNRFFVESDDDYEDLAEIFDSELVSRARAKQNISMVAQQE